MVLNSLDRIVTGYFPEVRARLTVANVTDTARTLERNHLCGPTAGLIQAEMVGGIVLLGTLLERENQAISLRMIFPNGSLGGASLECTAGFTVRGYTRQKILADLDDSDAADDEIFRRALGSKAQCGVVITEGTSASNTLFNVSSEDCISVTDIVEEYFCRSLQRSALVQVSGATKNGYVSCVHSLMCEILPEADAEMHKQIRKRFDAPEVLRLLDDGADLATLATALGLGHAEDVVERPVAFACSCSSERVINMLSSLPKADLEAMIAEDRPHDIYCHMCGKGFTITVEQLKGLL
jgi:molecular chaperone Hsp33